MIEWFAWFGVGTYATVMAICTVKPHVWAWLFGWMREIKLDPQDVFYFAGLGLMFTGLWMLQPWMACTVVGSLLVAFSTLPSLIRAIVDRGGRRE